MKIIASPHLIEQTDNVNLNFQIPLAYIDTNTTEYKTTVIPKLKEQNKNKIVPYKTFDSIDVCLFDENGNIVDNTGILQRNQDKYYYTPQNAISFFPQQFNYEVVIKKALQYRNYENYNLKVACSDGTEELVFAKKLMEVFGNAGDRGVCPKNISVNSRDTAVESLLDASIEELDFVFIRSKDGVHYEDTDTPIEIDEYLDNHTNVWLSVDDFKECPILSKEIEYFIPNKTAVQVVNFKADYAFDGQAYKNQNLILHNIFRYKAPDKITDGEIEVSIPVPQRRCWPPTGWEDYKKYKTATQFNTPVIPRMPEEFTNFTSIRYMPILILEKPKKGFIIVTPQNFIEDIASNVNIFYETLMYVYSNTYVKSKKYTDWIADVMPDYVVINNNLVKKDKFASEYKIHDMFKLPEKEIALSDLIIDAENVKFNGLTDGHIVFKKHSSGDFSKYADPVKPAGAISVFTPRQNIMFYDDFIYEINESVQDKISCHRQNNDIIIEIEPFKYSSKNINLQSRTILKASLIETSNYKEELLKELELYICMKDSLLKAVKKENYADIYGIIIAEVKVFQSEKQTKIIDMRQRGGGLPETEKDNYDMLDIGHFLGRPYRRAGAAIITLPKELEPHKALIEKAVKKYISAEELPILIFE